MNSVKECHPFMSAAAVDKLQQRVDLLVHLIQML